MITRVELVNFKSHASPGNVFEFTGGANAVLGPTGAGKTSVLQAIGLCVFDFGQPRHYLRKGTKKGEAIVTFRSPIDHKHYTIKRQLGGSRFHLLDEHGATLAETKDEALRTVRAKLGLDANADLEGLFAELIGTPQGQLTGAFLQKKEHRVEIFNHILKIEQYRNAYEALRPVESHGRTKIGQVNEQIIAVETRLEGAPQRAADLQATTYATVKARDTSTKAVEAQGVAVQALQSVGAEKQKADEAREALQGLSHKVVVHQQATKDLERRLAESTQAQAWLDENDADLKLGRAAEKYVEEHEATFKQHQSDLRTVTDTNLQHQKLQQDIGKWEARRIEKAKELQTAPDFAALAAQLAGLEGAEKEADAASQKTVGALEQAKARVTELPRIKKNWGELEKIRVAAASVPIAFQNGNHRARLDEGKLRVHHLTTLQGSLDGQFAALASKTCPLLDVSCPIPIANLSRARDEKKRHLVVDVRDAEGALVSLQRDATLEEAYARQLQAWEPRQAEHQEAAALVADLQKIHDGLPGVQQEATAKKQILVEAQTARRACETKISQRAHYDNLRSQVQELDRDMNAGRADLKKLEDLVANVQANVRALAPVAEAYESQRAARRRLAGLMEQAGARVGLAAEKTQRAAELGAAGTLLQALKSEEESEKKRVASLWTPDHQRRLIAAQKADKDAHANVVATDAALKGVVQRGLDLQKLVDQDNVNQALRNARRAEAADLESTQSHLEIVRKILNDAGPVIAKHFVAAISVLANQKYQELTGGQPARLRWTETYDVEITDMDGHTKGFAELSGGEQVMAALAIRLALLSETSRLSFAFFDEPTIHLDEDTRNHVADVLNHTGFEQMVVVSHDDSFSEKIHHAVRLRKNGTRTEPVRAFNVPGGAS